MEDKKIVIIDSNILDGKKINTKISNKKIAMLVLSAEMHTLLKQELKIAKNTVGFQNIMSQIKLHGLEYANNILSKTVILKENVNNVKEKLIDKSTLAKERINLKVAHAKNILIRKPAMEIALIKQSIREKAKLLASNTSAKIIESLRSREKVLEEKNANLAERKARIDALKKERETLLGQLTNDSNSYARSM